MQGYSVPIGENTDCADGQPATSIGPGVWPWSLNREARRDSASTAFTG